MSRKTTVAVSRVGGRAMAMAVALALATLLADAGSAAAQEYTIGPRDLLRITVWSHVDLSRDYPVGEDGRVQFPLIGAVEAAGLTPADFAGRLRTLLEKDYLVDPQVQVMIADYRSRKVQVLGEADKPGLYYLQGGGERVLDVISRAGGLAKTAGTHVVLVRPAQKGRAGPTETTRRLSLGKIQAGDLSENLLVQDEDTVFIPKAEMFFVLGEVKTPGTYPLDKAVSVLDAVTMAGGFTDGAAPAGVKVIRRGAEGQEQTFPVNLAGSLPADRAFPVANGDTVMVPKGNTFFVVGEVTRPGAYQLVKETSILEAIAIAGGFTAKAAPGRTRVIRRSAEGAQDMVVDMNEIIRKGTLGKAIRILEHDVIVVPESFF